MNDADVCENIRRSVRDVLLRRAVFPRNLGTQVITYGVDHQRLMMWLTAAQEYELVPVLVINETSDRLRYLELFSQDGRVRIPAALIEYTDRPEIVDDVITSKATELAQQSAMSKPFQPIGEVIFQSRVQWE